jgi:hypothetical protein
MKDGSDGEGRKQKEQEERTSALPSVRNGFEYNPPLRNPNFSPMLTSSPLPHILTLMLENIRSLPYFGARTLYGADLLTPCPPITCEGGCFHGRRREKATGLRACQI